MRYKPPCKTDDGIRCDKRHVGCHANCEPYQKWLAIHAEEMANERRKKDEASAVDGFLILQGERTRKSKQAAYERENRRRRR